MSGRVCCQRCGRDAPTQERDKWSDYCPSCADAPLTAVAILANDALAPDASRNKCRYLAGQASRRWLAEAQAATADMDYEDARDWLARAIWMQWRHPA